jgi:hypothetical protein
LLTLQQKAVLACGTFHEPGILLRVNLGGIFHVALCDGGGILHIEVRQTGADRASSGEKRSPAGAEEKRIDEQSAIHVED